MTAVDLSSAEHALVRAEHHRSDGELEDAEAAYFEAARQAMKCAPDRAEAAAQVVMRTRIGLGRVELMREAPDRALGWFLSAREIVPNDWRTRYWQGCAQGWLGDHEGAEQSFTAGLRLTPNELSLKVQRFCARLKMGDAHSDLKDLLTTTGGGLDSRSLHAISAAWLNRGYEPAGARVAVAATVALLHDEDFWDQFRASAMSRYQVPISTKAIAECRAEVEHRARARLVRDEADVPGGGPGRQSAGELLFLREMAAATILRDLGGLPSAGDGDSSLICGPLMISLLGVQRALGDFTAREPPADEAPPGLRRRLRQLFSGLGAATVLLDAERAEDALAALETGACKRCRTAAESSVYPTVCAPDCTDFDVLHVGYAGLRAKGSRLAEDATRLSITARLSAALHIVAMDRGDVGAAIRFWRDALHVAAAAGIIEQTVRQVSEAVLGRIKALKRKGLFSEAIELVEETIPLLGDSSANEELRSTLSELFTDRGVMAGNEERWNESLGDLRRGMDCNPQASRPRIYLSTVLQRLASHRSSDGDRIAARELLREAKRIVEGALNHRPVGPDVGRQLEDVKEDLRSLWSGWAVELAVDGAYRDALDVLDEGLTDLPADARLSAARDRLVRLMER